MSICDDEECRNAWEVLCDPVDWDKARALQPQDNEPFPVPEEGLIGMPSMLKPDMLIPAEDGWLAELTGGPDRIAEMRVEMDKLRAAGEGA